MAERNWGSNGGATTGATTGARTAYEEFSKNYNGAFLVAIGLAIVITFFEVMFSKAGGAWSIVNYWIGWGCLAAWAFLVFHPKGPGPVLFLAVMGFNAPWNELDDILTKLKLPDFKLKEMGEKGWQFLRMKYFVLAGHVALYLVLQSMVLATFDVSHGALVPGILLGFAGFGLWAALLTKAVVWYARIVFLTLFVTTGYAIAGTFAPEPSETEVIAAEVQEMSDAKLDKRNAKQVEAIKMRIEKCALSAKEKVAIQKPVESRTSEEQEAIDFVAGGCVLTPEQQATIDRATSETSKGGKLLEKAETFFRGRVIEYQVPENIASENLKPICGIPAGEYLFELGGDPTLQIKSPDGSYHIKLYGRAEQAGFHRPDYFSFGMMLNGSRVKDRVVVGKSGCVQPSFNLSPLHEKLFAEKEWTIGATTLNLILK